MKKLFLNSLFILFCFNSFSQNIDNIKAERLRLKRDIENAQKLLNNNKKEQSTIIENLNILNVQIKNRKLLVNSLTNEISYLKKSISVTDDSITILTTNIENGKRDYSNLVIELYKRRNPLDALNYILGSSSFNQAFLRYKMIQVINDNQHKCILLLQKDQELLFNKRNQLVLIKRDFESKLNSLADETKLYQSQISDRESYIKTLKGKERLLSEEISNKTKLDQALEEKILEIIASSAKTKLIVVEGNDFNKFKGKLLLPVNESIIINNFGEHDHPFLKGVKIKNNGIDLKATNLLECKSVFKGEVSRVIGIPGYNKAVIVRHGSYITVYANLVDVQVVAGQKVNSGTILGTIFSGSGDNSKVLHFEIWKENDKLDPQLWLNF